MMNFIINCPHCSDQILIEKINCGIFRHGSVKATGKRIGPHSKKAYCDKMFNKGLIYGCGKPFRCTINKINNTVITEICDYI